MTNNSNNNHFYRAFSTKNLKIFNNYLLPCNNLTNIMTILLKQMLKFKSNLSVKKCANL